MTAPDRIVQLVETFHNNLESYKRGIYNETQARLEFINPFFEALGWDMNNAQGFAESYKDVIHEDAIKVGGVTKAPDYCFRIGGTRKFFLEAKKPSVNIKEDMHPAFQLRRYAWSAKLPLSVLTDFEEFAVYDCRVKPSKTDKVSHSRIMYVRYEEYLDRWAEIANIFSKQAILKGSFDQYVKATKVKKGTTEVDAAFLEEIERWRDLLARNFALRNQGLSQRELNFAVQQTIDRIIFLRICEDRGIEKYGRLMALQNGGDVYPRLFELFRKADEKYNSGLFHFKAEKGRLDTDALTPNLAIDDKVLKDIFKNLYYPDSPYEFSVLSADILGQVYEKFLGKVITLTTGHQARIEEKPEVRKAGGVYYTPTYIVDYIVKNTVGSLLEDKKPGPRGGAARFKILDPACGSGSFLIGAYQYLLDWHLEQYLQDGPDKWTTGKTPRLYQTGKGDWRLTTDERKRILLNNIYGVDIDPQAVEVTKLSLLLKVLEGENEESIGKQMVLFQERVLPDLANNIKCGNSLINPDYYDHHQMTMFCEDDLLRVNAFDWNREFADIMQDGGFDAVIGNPPWGADFSEIEKKYLNRTYVNKKGEAESHLYFIEKATHLIKQNGLVGYITPNTWLSVINSKELRSYLLNIIRFTHISELSKYIFSDAPDIVPVLVFLTNENEKGKNLLIHRSKIQKITASNFDNQTSFKKYFINQEDWLNTFGNAFNLSLSEETKKVLFKCNINTEKLGTICNVYYGIKTGDNSKYLSNGLTETHTVKALKTGELVRYCINWKAIWLWWNRDLAGWRAHSLETPKIIIQYIRKLSLKRRIISAFDESGIYYPLNNYSYIQKGDNDYNLKYIQGVLNSSLINFYFANTFIDYNIKPTYLKEKPIIKIDFDNQKGHQNHQRLVALVDRMLELNKRLAESKIPQITEMLKRQIETTDNQIDQLVYQLYGLTDEEIQIIESEVR